jgi:hypothetical protein
MYSTLLSMLALVLAGCSLSVNKSTDGKDKNVKIDTPLGGIHVTSDGTVAASLGLPAYPGATAAPDKDGDKSADVHMGFGGWQFRIKVVAFQTGDSTDKVLAFYRKALGRYGDVIECQNGQPVGTPEMTHEGLTCKDDGGQHHDGTKTNFNDIPHALKAGSQRHQHIVGIKTTSGSGTKFALIELDLPASIDNSKSESD